MEVATQLLDRAVDTLDSDMSDDWEEKSVANVEAGESAREGGVVMQRGGLKVVGSDWSLDGGHLEFRISLVCFGRGQ